MAIVETMVQALKISEPVIYINELDMQTTRYHCYKTYYMYKSSYQQQRDISQNSQLE